MEKRELQERIVTALIARGYAENPCAAGKLVSLKVIGSDPPEFYYVGVAGGLAKGPRYGHCHSVPRTFKENLLKP